MNLKEVIKICKFFSAISNGKGRVLFFKVEDIHKIEKKGNPHGYNFNSHTSVAHYNGILGANEDKWNKWEYNCEKKELKIDGNYNTKDDTRTVKKEVEKYIKNNGALYLQKVYNQNTGDSNTGYRNTGYRNTGNWNTGYRNTGDSNTGYRNTGDSNTGDSNTGDSNTGDSNTGYRNTGDSNTGDRNTGYRNTGNWNTGDRNTGYLNTINTKIRIFNKVTNKKDIVFPNYFYFDIISWINVWDMTDNEKKEFWWYKTTQGYLRTIEYKEAWKNSFEKANKEDIVKTLKLPNFNYKIFEEISGITKEMIQKKLKE